MSVEISDYAPPNGLAKFLDVDPTFDPNWADWIFKRPYVYCPAMTSAVKEFGRIDYNRLIISAEELGSALLAIKAYNGSITDTRISTEQIKFVLGLLRGARGSLRPVKLDKALLSAFAINKVLTSIGKSPIAPKFFVGAYNIHGLSDFFNSSKPEVKQSVRTLICKETGQNDGFVGEFLRGQTASIDFVVLAHQALFKDGTISGSQEFSDHISPSLASAIKTPSNKYTTAAAGEDFAISRVEDLPPPFSRI